MEIEKRCKWCGKVFLAHKVTTLYCSPSCTGKAYKQRQKEERLKEYQRDENTKLPILGLIGNKDFLSPTEVSLLLGISRSTVYRYMSTGQIKALQLKGKTIIRRSDLERMFDDAPNYKRRSYGRKEVLQYYTMSDIVERYNISRKAAKGRLIRMGIQPIYEGRNTFYNKNAVEINFAELLEEIHLENYYTTEQIMEKYAMTKGAVLSFVQRHNIPRINRLKKVYYAKSHIDSMKGNGYTIDPEYYTYEEILKKFNFSKDQASYYVNTYHVDSFKRGKFTMVSRVDFDKVMQMRMNGTLTIKQINEKYVKEQQTEPTDTSIPDGYCNAEEIAHKYNLTMKYARKVARENKIPFLKINRYNYYEMKVVEFYFSKYIDLNYTTEWLTGEQVEQMYLLTPFARKSFVYRHKIPSKKIKGITYYSKVHIDEIKECRFKDSDQYISIEEIMQYYSINRDCVYNYAKYYKIKKIKKGKKVFFIKNDFDNIINKKLIK